MKKTMPVVLLAVVAAAQIPLWTFVGWLVHRTDYLQRVTSVSFAALAVASVTAIAGALLSRFAWSECWDRRRSASALFGLSLLNFACLFCLMFFGYAWEYHAGKPFGLLEAIKAWF